MRHSFSIYKHKITVLLCAVVNRDVIKYGRDLISYFRDILRNYFTS